MKAITGIKNGLERQDELSKIARKIFLSYSTEIFNGDEDTEFYIKDRIARQFDVPFSSIEIVGSSKTGFSFFKDSKFRPGVSDLDIAVISLPLFVYFSEVSHFVTNGFSDLSLFTSYRNQRTDRQFVKGLSNGYINPYFMPNCDVKKQWLDFFNSLSNNYFKLFKNINGGIYSSEYYFEFKQEQCIYEFVKDPSKYDKISS